MAQRKRIGPITQGSVDRNYLPLCYRLFFTHALGWSRNVKICISSAEDSIVVCKAQKWSVTLGRTKGVSCSCIVLQKKVEEQVPGRQAHLLRNKPETLSQETRKCTYMTHDPPSVPYLWSLQREESGKGNLYCSLGKGRNPGIPHRVEFLE